MGALKEEGREIYLFKTLVMSLKPVTGSEGGMEGSIDSVNASGPTGMLSV